MTEDQKHNLLRKDLCARFPYYVKLKVKYENDPWTLFVMHQSEKIYVIGTKGYPIEVKLTDCQPYLRSMSSMTQEEKQELKDLLCSDLVSCSDFGYLEGGTFVEYISSIPYSLCIYVIDWLNAHHFDYRGLIEKGLAIDCTNLNIY